jgi:hypothetical protein
VFTVHVNNDNNETKPTMNTIPEILAAMSTLGTERECSDALLSAHKLFKRHARNSRKNTDDKSAYEAGKPLMEKIGVAYVLRCRELRNA